MPRLDGVSRGGRPVVIGDRVAEVEHLLGSTGPEDIARRLGYRNVDVLLRIMRRAGRHDLSRKLYVSRSRRG